MTAAPRTRGKETQLDRFLAKVMPEPMSGCWLWIGALQPKSYGKYGIFQILGKTHSTGAAHIFSYRAFGGAIPEGFEIDHLCRNPQCVNPKRLEAVTRRVNLMRGNTLVAINGRKTHCPAGHPYEGANVYYQFGRTGTMRVCKTCKREKARARYTSRRASVPSASRYLGVAQ